MGRGPMEIADLLVAHLTVKLQDAGEDPASFCALTVYPGDDVPGDYAVEDCGAMAYVRLTGANPTVSFPGADLTVDNCSYTLAYGFEVGILRAAAMPVELLGGGLELPSPEEQHAQAEQQYKDLATLHAAMKAARRDLEQMVLGPYMPTGPSGGIYGGYWTLTAGDD